MRGKGPGINGMRQVCFAVSISIRTHFRETMSVLASTTTHV